MILIYRGLPPEVGAQRPYLDDMRRELGGQFRIWRPKQQVGAELHICI